MKGIERNARVLLRSNLIWKKMIAGVMNLLLLLAVIPTQCVFAASATITLSTTEEEIHVGDTVEVSLTIKSDATIGDFEAFISYDETVFEFYSAASCITGGAGSLKVSDIGASPSRQDRTYRMYFKAIATGTCEVALYDRPIVYGYSDGAEMSVTGFSKVFTVLPSRDASDNNYLSALLLVDNRAKTIELQPAFSPDIMEYHANVPVSSELLIVSAIAEDMTADVEVSGARMLVLGENEAFVKVTAEDGSERMYKIYIYRSEQEELPSENTEQPEENDIPREETVIPQITMIPGIQFAKEESSVLVTEYHTYTIGEKPEGMVLPDGYLPTTLMINEVSVPAYARQGEMAEEFLLLVLKNEAGVSNLYRYDRVEQTLQRVNEEEYTITQVVQNEDEGLKEALHQYEVQQIALTFAISFLIGICLVLLIIILWLCIRRRNRGQTE